ncbi:MAG: hypothetical protein KDD61_09415 [Bdellovibrionales bacterium]|nr:hypothetical protein [Bdellovibrionales bacterium]
MSFLSEIWMFLKVRKKYWLLPILITLLILGILVVFAQGTAVSPFIYTLI